MLHGKGWREGRDGHTCAVWRLLGRSTEIESPQISLHFQELRMELLKPLDAALGTILGLGVWGLGLGGGGSPAPRMSVQAVHHWTLST